MSAQNPNRGPFYKSPTSAEIMAAYQAMADAITGGQALHGDGPPVDGVTGLGATSKVYQNDSPAADEAVVYVNTDPASPSVAPVWRGLFMV